MNWTSMIITLVGGLALFLYGMAVMTESLKMASKGKLKPFLARMVSNRWKALIAGTGITALIQSSSVTTVLAVGFVSAGLLQFQQTIGIILGSGIGTTITAQIVAFKVTSASLVFIAIGFLLSSIFTARVYQQLGKFLLGLGLIFLGMNLMGEGTEPLKSYQPFIDAMKGLDNPVWGILLGAVFTALVQSSSATTGVVIMLTANGLIAINPAISIVIGANIGTCVTALISAIGKPRASLQVAMAHVLFKTIGALAWVAFIPQLALLVNGITPNDVARQVANAHTIFNVANALIMIWFTTPFARLVKFIVPDRIEQKEQLLPPLDPYYLNHTGVALDLVQDALNKLGTKVHELTLRGIDVVLYGNSKNIEALKNADDQIDAGHTEIILYMHQLQQLQLLPQEVQRLNHFIETANIIESVADLVTTNLSELAANRIENQITIKPETAEKLKKLYLISVLAYEKSVIAIKKNTSNTLDEQEKLQFKDQITECRNYLIARFSSKDTNSINTYKFENEIVEITRQLHTLARRISRKNINETSE